MPLQHIRFMMVQDIPGNQYIIIIVNMFYMNTAFHGSVIIRILFITNRNQQSIQTVMKRFLFVSVMIMQDLKECYSFRKAILPSCCCQPYI